MINKILEKILGVEDEESPRERAERLIRNRTWNEIAEELGDYPVTTTAGPLMKKIARTFAASDLVDPAAQPRDAPYISADPDPRTSDDGDESAEAILGHA